MSEEALTDNLAKYQVDSASERTSRDRMVRNWLELLNKALTENVEVNYLMINKVIENMNAFLDHAGGRRK